MRTDGKQYTDPQRGHVTKAITFDGYDGPDLVCPMINVWHEKYHGNISGEGWRKKKAKALAGFVWHGQKGELLKRSGRRCKIRVDKIEGLVEIPKGTPSGFEGWVTFWFIKELKVDWQKE